MRDLVLVGITALASAAAGALLTLSLTGIAAPASSGTTGDYEDVTALVARIDALEAMLATRPQETPPAADAAAAAGDQLPAGATPEPSTDDSERRSRSRAEILARRRSQTAAKLREAGWTDAEISMLQDARIQVGLDMERQQYEAARKVLQENPDMAVMWMGRSDGMRKTLGDERYESYLEAMGRPAAVAVDTVLAGSTGAAAGLQPGDRIRRYDAERVFDEQDLMRAMLAGDPDDTVTIEIERDGATFHVSVPRGPLGTSATARHFAESL